MFLKAQYSAVFRAGMLTFVLMMPASAFGTDMFANLFGRAFNKAQAARPEPEVTCDPVLDLAHGVTKLEDDIRRNGSITIKQPDVWGDANLLQYIQEYEQQLKAKGNAADYEFKLQAFINRTDQMTLVSETALGLASGNRLTVGGSTTTSTPVPVPGVATTGITLPTGTTTAGSVTASPATLPVLAGTPGAGQDPVFVALSQFMPATKDAVAGSKVGVEPTEFLRQLDTYLAVNHSLRRRNSGDDNSRLPGYGLYLFRVPVNVLPGRQTYRGHSAVVTLQAHLQLDPTHLKTTFKRLMVADAVDRIAPEIIRLWDPKVAAQVFGTAMPPVVETRLVPGVQPANAGESGSNDSPAEPVPLPPGVAPEPPNAQPQVTADSGTPISPEAVAESIVDIYGQEGVAAAWGQAKRAFSWKLDGQAPRLDDLRRFLFTYFHSIDVFLTQRKLYDTSDLIAVGQLLNVGATLDGTQCGQEPSLNEVKCYWEQRVQECAEPGAGSSTVSCDLVRASWILAIHAAELDFNLKRILRNMAENHKLSPEAAALIDTVMFYAPDMLPEESRVLWEDLVRVNFPLYVFTLDPLVEEQNVFETLMMRREMQLALAIGVANGNINLAQRVALSRKLGLDQAGIDLNRTAVGFTHGQDVFGWYFYPRVQAPPPEEYNLGALYRLVWKGGPGRSYDLKHRELEPGIRECEVLIVMPSFVTGVSFDVTTNWESIEHPGVVKRSYEEMLLQGRQLVEVRNAALARGDTGCYRPGDFERLLSRVDQLEQLLGMQTYEVRVPYQYQMAGHDLFDLGDSQLAPVLSDFYGLEYLKTGNTLSANFFITGKNFHPTQTHVIVGGNEAHTAAVASPFSPENNTTIAAGQQWADLAETHHARPGDVEVISRELIRVRVTGLDPNFTMETVRKTLAFHVRVATPAGVSNYIKIESRPPAPAIQPSPTPKPPGFSWDKPSDPLVLRLASATEASEIDIPQLYYQSPTNFSASAQSAELVVELNAVDDARPNQKLVVFTQVIQAHLSGNSIDPGNEAEGIVTAAIQSVIGRLSPDSKWTFSATAHIRFGAGMPFLKSVGDPLAIKVEYKPRAALELPVPQEALLRRQSIPSPHQNRSPIRVSTR